MSKNFFIDFHVVQTVPPSCINRDDIGSPKTAVYGGVTRARVSSQSWKRAMRKEFSEMFREGNLGVRTKRYSDLLARKICEMDNTVEYEKASDLAKKILELGSIKGDGKDVLFFFSQGQIDALAKLALENGGNKLDKKAEKEFKERVHEALIQNPSVDIALFGKDGGI